MAIAGGSTIRVENGGRVPNDFEKFSEAPPMRSRRHVDLNDRQQSRNIPIARDDKTRIYISTYIPYYRTAEQSQSFVRLRWTEDRTISEKYYLGGAENEVTSIEEEIRKTIPKYEYFAVINKNR